MKVTPVTDNIYFLNRVREKHDAQGDRDRGSQEQNKKRRDDEPTEFQAGLEQIEQAVDAFGNDVHAKANGLNAMVSGSGPGLKVTLKDGSGAIVRQFTGEEFLQLREAVSRGKILDRKF